MKKGKMIREKGKGTRSICASAILTAAILIVAAFTVGIAPVSANPDASVTRDLPDEPVNAGEEIVVKLTQEGFLLDAVRVDEILPDGFEYVAGSYTGYYEDYDSTKNSLMLILSGTEEREVSYNVTTGTLEEIDDAIFTGVYRGVTVDLFDPVEDLVGGDTMLTAGSLEGSIVGTVTYACNGTAIAGAAVKLTQGGAEIDSTTTDAGGDYAFTVVSPGDYYVNASKSGFWEKSTAVTVAGGEMEIADMMLWLKGDLNNDGDVADAVDVNMMIQASVGDYTGDWKFDLNNDGDVADAVDVNMMIQASVDDYQFT
jgi:hypothetical protein